MQIWTWMQMRACNLNGLFLDLDAQELDTPTQMRILSGIGCRYSVDLDADTWLEIDGSSWTQILDRLG